LKLIKRLFGKKDVAPTLVSLELCELPEWMEVRSENIFSRLHHHIRQKYNEIEVALGDLGVSKEHLNDVNTVDDAYKQIAKAGISNKDNVVKNIGIIIDRTIIPQDATISAANEFYTSTKSGLKTLIENTMRSQQYAKALFPEEYRGVMDGLSHLETLLDELMAPINEVRDKLDAYDRLKESVETISQYQQQIVGNEDLIPDLEKKYDSLENELQSLESKLEGVVKSEEFTKAHELEKQVKTLEGSLSDIDSNVKSMFAPLSKALSRMEKQDASGRYKMSPKSKEILLAIRDNPVSILGTGINGFLDEIRGRIEDGTLGLKQQKMNNTIKQLDKLGDSDILSSLSEKRGSCSSELEEVKSELNRLTVYEEKTRFEKEMSACRSRIDSTKNDLETERTDQAALREKIEGSIADLNSDLKFVFGTDVEVIHPSVS
jgi:predicted RNase H-like nuclease (RuvC/YqgF family)